MKAYSVCQILEILKLARWQNFVFELKEYVNKIKKEPKTSPERKFWIILFVVAIRCYTGTAIVCDPCMPHIYCVTLFNIGNESDFVFTFQSFTVVLWFGLAFDLIFRRFQRPSIFVFWCAFVCNANW